MSSREQLVPSLKSVFLLTVARCARVMDAPSGSSDNNDNVRSDPNELTSGIHHGVTHESTALTELTTGIADRTSTESGDLSELKEVVCVKDTNESGVEQLSSLDDGDVEEQLSNLNNGDEDTKCLNLCCLVIKGIAYIIVSSFAFRVLPYFSNVFNSLDATIVVVTLLLEIVYNAFGFTALKDVPKLTVFTRPLRLFVLLRAVHLAHQERHLEALTRRMIRDMTYASCISGEKAYDPEYFHHRVRQYMIDDHNVPSLMDVEKWMAQDEENIIVVHCKGGKGAGLLIRSNMRVLIQAHSQHRIPGRTGTMICAYLLASERFTTAEDSLCYFGERRTDKSTSNKYQGVETPSQGRPFSTKHKPSFDSVTAKLLPSDPPVSQSRLTASCCDVIVCCFQSQQPLNSTWLLTCYFPGALISVFFPKSRFVGYFAKVKNTYNLHLPPRKILKINKFVIYSIHGVGKGDGSDLEVQIMMKRKTVFFCSASRYCKALPRYYDNCPFYFWFHTSFIQENRLYLSRNELDNPHKPKTWKIYRSDFAVEVYFDEVKL
ncbi:phosphatidylinositol 3,4,5-trisphosphate 3-phosphatase TPTE2 isoform gamma [Camelus ferus]|nr:phosphatidylinositol 3,4,5-trisphosphate 3-phosphatase TPTE2 isoform gamma [Camelus ferus]